VRVKRALAGLLTTGAVLAGAAALPAAAAASDVAGGRNYELVSPLASAGLNFDEAWSWYDGESALFTSTFDSNGTFLSRRTPTGWQVERIGTPPGSFLAYAPPVADGATDMSRLFTTYTEPFNPLDPDDPPIFENVAMYEDGAWTTIARGARFVAASADGRRVLMTRYAGRDPYPALPGSIYLWEDGEVSAVGADVPAIVTAGAVAAPPASRRFWQQTGMSNDGRVVFLSAMIGSSPSPTHLYVSVDGVTTDVTVPVAGATDRGATMLGHAADGSAFFFRSATRLEDSDDDNSADYFRYDVATRELVRVTAARTAAGQPIVNAFPSDDGKRLWMIREAGSGPVDALWVWTAGSGEQLVRDQLESSAGDYNNVSGPAQVSRDGSWFVWRGNTRWAGGPTPAFGQMMRAGVDGSIVCISCVGPSTVGTDAPESPGGFTAPRMRVADDGTVAFTHRAALVPEDQNAVADVYGFRDDQLFLVSAGGADSGPSTLAGVTPSGDIFFRSYDRLLPWIDDSHEKVYVARVGGGLPAPPAPPHCDGDSCQGDPTPAGPGGTPPSESHTGPGDAEDPEPAFPRDPVHRAKLKLTRPSAKAKRALAAGRRATLTVRSSEAGRLTATVQVRSGKRWIRAARATRRLGDEGTAKLTVRLSAKTRRLLAQRGTLRARVVVTHRTAARPARTAFVLKRQAGRRG
jgi:hypothetical protein